MALLLSGERTSAAALILYPLRSFAALVGKLRAVQVRRQAFQDLLALDPHRLSDLGVERSDLFDAMATDDNRSGRLLADRRARRSSNWLNP